MLWLLVFHAMRAFLSVSRDSKVRFFFPLRMLSGEASRSTTASGPSLRHGAVLRVEGRRPDKGGGWAK
jgi:hypothetical protein